VAIATLDRSYESAKSQSIWGSVLYEVEEAVLEKAEAVGLRHEDFSSSRQALAAQELGFRGARETLDRVLAVTAFADDQKAGTHMIEDNYAFGRALAGDASLLESRENIDPTIHQLAEILRGVPPGEVTTVFQGRMAKDLSRTVNDAGLDRARLLAWPDAPASEIARVAQDHPDVLFAAYEMALTEERATPNDLTEVLLRMPVDVASTVVTQLTDVAPLAQAMDLREAPVELLVAMMANRGVVEASLRAAEDAEG
jgi:hypothetical protein